VAYTPLCEDDSMAGNPFGKQSRERRTPVKGKKPEALSAAVPSASRPDNSAIISRRAADRLRSGHVWVYRSDLTALPENPPSLISVCDARGALLGSALYSPSSEIALRLVSREQIASEAEWLGCSQTGSGPQSLRDRRCWPALKRTPAVSSSAKQMPCPA
jgi:hypothetical protein